MSVRTEEDLLIMEEVDHNNNMPMAPPPMHLETPSHHKDETCVISKQGLTLFGYHVSWFVIVLVVVAVWYMMKQQKSGQVVQSFRTEPLPMNMAGGGDLFFDNFDTVKNSLKTNRGEIRKMFGH